MARFHEALLVQSGLVATGLQRMLLQAPELARQIRAGQFLLLRCSEPGQTDRLLRRTLYAAEIDREAGMIGLLFAPVEPGLRWLAARPLGDRLDLIGPFGKGFEITQRSGSLLLIGQGPGCAALLPLARESIARGMAVTCLVGALNAAVLLPPMLLPPEVEYQSAAADGSVGLRGTVLNLLSAPQLLWADQVCAALPSALLPILREAVRAAKYQWERGYAQILVEAALPCGVGACGACYLELRTGWTALCREGPVIDLKSWAT